ncbi:MAG: metallophosphoesterase [Spartobacteria bacterium]|nr:metallophosphoesterase [Spartobacteria bacterium]
MKIIHFSDIHLWDGVLEWRDLWYPKRLLGYVNLSLRRKFRFPPEYARRVTARILEQEADLVVFSGDMTTASLKNEFKAAAALFAPLHDKWGERFFVLPGNHDRYTPVTVGDLRYERTFPYGAMPGADVRVRVLDVDDEWRVIGFDCSRPYMLRSNGHLDEALLRQLDDALGDARLAGRSVILTGHFPYATPSAHKESWQHKLIGEEQLARLVARHQPPVYLHGHKHVRWLFRPDGTPATVCVNSGSAGLDAPAKEKRAGFITLTLDPDHGLTACLAQALSSDGAAWETCDLSIIQCTDAAYTERAR